ncbi:MAG: amino acid adenylation domain-containing protein [Cyanobacteria bacterium J06559_1]
MKNVVDIYPLTPVQLGMLFHTLAKDSAQDSTQNGRGGMPRAGVYVNQFTCVLRGEVQAEWLRQAWRQTVARYAVLRTAVLWEGLDEPLQVVREQVDLPWQQLDWRGMGEGERSRALRDFLKGDRTQGFDLSQAPALRLTLIQLTDDTYQFIWSNHHLLYDGWSLLLIWQDVLAGYAALVTESAYAPAPVRPFRDYIAWQQQQETSAAKTFWQDQLRDVFAPTPLPAARLSYLDSGRPYRQQSKRLTTELSTALSELAKQHRLTLNTLVQGAWALLLHHYSDGVVDGSDDTSALNQVTYGSVVSGRPAALSGVETMVGLFINTLPVTVAIEPEQSLMPWLQARQQQLLKLREYEATPLIDIQRWSGVPQGSPLFESIVAFENISAAPALNLSFSVSDEQYLEQSNYPLALLVFPEKGLDLRLLYDVDRFEDERITQLLAHLEQLLMTFVERPESRLVDLPRLTPLEQGQIQQQLEQQISTGSQTDFSREPCIHQLIEAQVERTPDAVALAFAGDSLTYAELNQQANQLARVLCDRGAISGTRVALCLPRSLDMVVGILAVLKSGAAYVPLDPAYPEARLAYCLQDTEPQLLVTHRSVTLPASSVPCLYLDEVAVNAELTENLEVVAQPEDLAYIIYTSGSTGNPKGVMVSHRNLVHSTTARFEVYAQPVERFLLLSSISFDSSIAGVFWTLCQGGTLVLSPRRIEQDLQQLSVLIADNRITHTLCVPTLYALLLDSVELQQLATLKTVIVAGEACSRTLAQQHFRKLPSTELYNEYGPTEGTVWCTAYRVPAVLPSGAISIGSAIPSTQIYLLNPDLQPVPAGAVGEIYIGGEGVAQGYLNQPEKTKGAFVSIPYSLSCWVSRALPNLHASQSRLYKTGDLGRYRADGSLEWLGRCDRQVKIRGYRIELGEIEEVLRSQPNVQEAVVVAQPVAQPASADDASVESLVSALRELSAELSDRLLSAIEGGQ